jgi:Zn-dependent protease with chaperone function
MINKNSLINYILNPKPPVNTHALIKDRLLLLMILAGIYLLFSLLGIGCPLKFTTGITCPGCGMTRAFLSLFHLDVGLALYYHPLFMVVPLMCALYLADFYINPRLVRLLWLIIIALFLTIYVYRLFISKSAVVAIDLSSGILIRIIQFILP